MAEQIPINPRILVWARTKAGVALEDARRVFARIADWEEGSSFPTYVQLEQLSANYRVPVAVFFFPEPPELPNIEETFRTLPDAEIERLPSRVRLLLRKAKALQLNLVEMTDGRNPAPKVITKDLSFDLGTSVDHIGVVVRQYLGVSLGEQIGWADDDEALKEWRSAFVEAGIFVFKDAFRVEDYSAFCLYDRDFPLIYVNNSSAKTRQIFSLFHELAHLLFQTSGVDSLSDSYLPRLGDRAAAIEVLCNRFASRFLLPEDVLTESLRGRLPSEETAQAIAGRFHVSRESVFRRFLDRNLIGQPIYEEAARRWSAQRQPGGAGGDYYWTKLAYLGREYVELALKQFRQNRIDENQLADYLDVKPRNVASLEEYFERGAA